MQKLGNIRVGGGQGLEELRTRVKKECDRVFTESTVASVKTKPSFNSLMAALNKGDVLVTAAFSELAGSTRNLLQIVDSLQSKGASMISYAEGLDTSTEAGKVVLASLNSLNELDKASIGDWMRSRIEASKRKCSTIRSSRRG